MTSREAFERYATSQHLDITRETEGNYYESDTQFCYEVWQEAVNACKPWLTHRYGCALLADGNHCTCSLSGLYGENQS